MKRHQFENYKIMNGSNEIIIISNDREYKIAKEKVKDVFSLVDKKTIDIRWYHRVLTGVVYAALSIMIFIFSFIWIDNLTAPTLVEDILFWLVLAIDGVLFIGLIIMLYEMSSDFPGTTLFLAKKLGTQKHRMVLISTVKQEYQFVSRSSKGQKVLEQKLRAFLS